jgi:imidazole glycerol-phosphate synthase subunit HisF
MLRSRIIPVLLIRAKGLVKTRQFADDKYVGDPINAVKIFNEKEVDELTLLDLDATVTGSAPDTEALRKIAIESRMPLCYGGGITNAEQAAEIISLGFEKVSVSAAAVARPRLIREMADRVGRQSVVVTLDVRQMGEGYQIHTHNGLRPAGVDFLSFLRTAEEMGAGEIVINNIDRDGMMTGYDLDLARRVRAAVSTPLSFVGGAANTRHMAELIEAVGTVGAAAGSMFVFKGPLRAVLISYARPQTGVQTG